MDCNAAEHEGAKGSEHTERDKGARRGRAAAGRKQVGDHRDRRGEPDGLCDRDTDPQGRDRLEIGRKGGREDREGGVLGKSVSVSVDLGGRRIIKKNKYQNTATTD